MKCTRVGCEKDATKQPFITFTAIGFPNAARARIEMGGLLVCDEHANITAKEMFTDLGWQKIVQVFKDTGYAEPDRKSIRFEYEQLH